MTKPDIWEVRHDDHIWSEKLQIYVATAASEELAAQIVRNHNVEAVALFHAYDQPPEWLLIGELNPGDMLYARAKTNTVSLDGIKEMQKRGELHHDPDAPAGKSLGSGFWASATVNTPDAKVDGDKQ